jgi:hypothetical protein
MVVEALVGLFKGDNKVISGFRKYNCGTGLKNRFAAYFCFTMYRKGDNLLSIFSLYIIYTWVLHRVIFLVSIFFVKLPNCIITFI